MEAAPFVLCEVLRPELEWFIREYGLPGNSSPVYTPPRCKGGVCKMAASNGACLSLFAPPWLVRNLVREGALLVSPGWLANWESHVAAWGFTPEGLKEFAAETLKKICLLDTLVIPGIEARLPAIAEAFSLPGERIPVGMDYAASRIKLLTRAPGGRGESPDAIMERRQSDYAMAFDLLSTLGSIKEEAGVIRELLSVYSMLFAPGSASIVRYQDGRPAGIFLPYQDEQALSADMLALCRQMDGSCGVELRDGSIIFPLDFLNERLALVRLGDFALPERGPGYRILVEALVSVCALAIKNARNIEAIQSDKEALQNKQNELVAIMAQKDRLFSIIAHDLRGPVGGIRSAIELILSDMQSGRNLALNTELLREVFRTSHETYLLLMNLLAWGRNTQGCPAGTVKKNAIHPIVESVFSLLGWQAKEKGVALINGVDPGFELEVNEDAVSLIIRNLVSNSVKFTSRGDQVRVLTGGPDARNLIIVEDDGVGMDDDTLRGLESLSETISKPGTRGERGSGFGLSLCRDLMEKNGGRMMIESSRGKGTVVTLVFAVR